jgi:thiosulfate reductase cytochrome b subunit
LQRLVYLSLAALILPVQMGSGFLYWGYNNWEAWGLTFLSLQLVAIVHLLGGFAILSFLLVHIYMTTTGHSIFAHIRAMITGWEEVEEGEKVEDWERAGEKSYRAPTPQA